MNKEEIKKLADEFYNGSEQEKENAEKYFSETLLNYYTELRKFDEEFDKNQYQTSYLMLYIYNIKEGRINDIICTDNYVSISIATISMSFPYSFFEDNSEYLKSSKIKLVELVIKKTVEEINKLNSLKDDLVNYENVLINLKNSGRYEN